MELLFTALIMKKIIVLDKNDLKGIVGEFDSIEDAQAYVFELAQKDKRISIFNLTIKEVEYEDVPTAIPNYEVAKSKFKNAKVETVFGIMEHNTRAIIALNKLFTIAEAWNKADKFVPDFSNRNQYKYFPYFRYNDKTASFFYANTKCTYTYAGGYFGSRLCFKSEERAKQFGEQFIDLWNDFLSFN